MARSEHPGTGAIELRVGSMGQLFHTLDPMPFRERDLDASVEEYIAGCAGEMRGRQPISILVHLPSDEAAGEEARHIEAAIQSYFAYRVEVLGWSLRDLFSAGRMSLAVGLAVLAACIVAGSASARIFGTGYLARFFEEGVIILGWVANWRPVEMFLYDWWPIVRRRRLYRRLAMATVRIIPDDGDSAVG